MAQLDQFIHVMLDNPGSEFLLSANCAPRLARAGKERELIARKLAPAQIRHLLKEILPASTESLLADCGFAEFTYIPAGKDVIRVSVREWGGDTEASFRRATSAPAIHGHDPGPLHDADSGPTPGTYVPAVQPPVGVPTIESLFREMVRSGCSDLHLSTGEFPIIRKDGQMLRLPGYPSVTMELMTKWVLSIMPARNRKQYDELKDADFAYEIPGLSRFRCNVFLDRNGMGAVFRTIPTKIVTVDELGLSKGIQNLCYLSKGLVLVTGPTGSGKSTTLCALVDLINRERHDHIITIEDPIEFVHTNKNCLVNQREVGEHTATFKSALRAALREDPDIVLVGELRDLETVSIAIETAETGHLVFATLHTSTAYSTIDRVIDQFPSDRQAQIRVMLSESLKGVISQTLCRKIGGGRVAALEVLFGTPAVSNLIREGKTFQLPSVMQTSKKAGMQLLNDALMELVQTKKVEPKEAYVKAVDKGNFTNMLKQAGHSLDFLGTAT